MTHFFQPRERGARASAVQRRTPPKFRSLGPARLAAWLLLGCGGGGDAKPPDGGGDGGSGGGGSVEDTLPSEPRCSSDGVCWYSPKPQGEALDHVWASAADDAWAIGESGVVMRWDGMGWAHTPTGVDAPLYGLWGSGPNDIWVVGEETVLRWDSDGWRELEDLPVQGVSWRAVLGSGPEDVWLVGEETALRYNGTEWTEHAWPRNPGGALVDTWTAAPDDFWVLCEEGAVHWDGSELTEQTLATVRSGPFRALAATHADDIWALGEDGAASHFDGTEWTGDNLGTRDIQAAWAFADGTLWGASRGSIYRLEDEGWRLEASLSGNPGLTETIADLAGTSDGTVFAVGAGGLIGMWNGGGWSTAGARKDFADVIAGIAADDFWTGGLSGLSRWRPSRVDRYHSSSISHVSHVHAFDAEHAWALHGVSNREIARWNGKAWEVHDIGARTRGLWATGPTDLWVLTDATQDAILRGDGNQLETMAGSPGSPEAIWASGPEDVWVVTDDAVMRWRGSEWIEMNTGLEDPPDDVSGSASDHVWVFDTLGDARRFDGTDWHAHPLPEGSCDSGVPCYGPFFVRGADDVWVAQRRAPRLLHWNGSEWQPHELPTQLSIRALWGKDNTLWIVTRLHGILVLRD